MPVPLDGWRDRPDKRIYVWFDAVVGYLSASIEWARRSGDDDAWRQWWQSPDSDAYYFMGKDNIVFHAEIWPAQLLGYNGEGDKGGAPGSLGRLNLPTEVVSSEFLTMEGRKFSSSRQVVIYVRDFLARYDADALRYFIAVAGPGEPGHRLHLGGVPPAQQRRAGRRLGQPGQPVGVDGGEERRRRPGTRRPERCRPGAAGRHRRAFATVGELLSRNRQKAAITEAMRVVGEANKYLSDQAPWKLKEDPARRDTVLFTALQAVSDCNALLTPFLPHAAQKVHELLGGTGRVVTRAAGAGGRRPRRRVALLGHHRRLRRRRSGVGVPAAAAGHADLPADAGVPEARRVGGRRRAGPAGGGGRHGEPRGRGRPGDDPA